MRPFLSILLVLTLSLTPLLSQMQVLPEQEPEQPVIRYEASNGVVLEVSHHDDHRDFMGRDAFGESITIHVHVSTSPHLTTEARFGDRILRTWYLDDGTVEWIELETPGGVLRHDVLGEQQELEAQAEAGIVSDVPPELQVDMRVYEELSAYGLTRASSGFYQDMEAAGREYEGTLLAVPAGCALGCWGCAATILFYGVSMAALIASCGATAGLSCWLALLGSYTAKTSVLLSCLACYLCMQDEELSTDDPRESDGDHDSTSTVILW